ncbi:hypothetical protein K227x_48910 [Rubripirellula lacrimiformis]|uniref:Uncharacterized protein n=1 Tax=Rubripirellula lacrimiformis TaxID=1930273 RepID=A0A517NH65_9BACT|nr:hypothetical protein [Rubripirellula lacrimiformis]QDT06481.1 hypothetical protein K227x_48910 [Rubripirellula lacrimiformis]
MDVFQQNRIGFALSLIALVVGVSIPGFYDWTGADQSRPSPWVPPAALAVLMLAVAGWVCLPFLKLGGPAPDRPLPRQRQFSIRALLITITAVAALCAAGRLLPDRGLVAVAGAVQVMALAMGVGQWVKDRSVRGPMIAMAACLCLPYAWIGLRGDGISIGKGLFAIMMGLPALVETMLVARLWGRHPGQLAWVGMLITSAKWMFGLWIIRHGPRSAVAYWIYVLLMSVYGSFILNAIVRM